MADNTTEKKRSFFSGVKSEFKKITWPEKDETMKQSVVVVVVSVIVGVLIAVMDYVIQLGVNFITSL